MNQWARGLCLGVAVAGLPGCWAVADKTVAAAEAPEPATTAPAATDQKKPAKDAAAKRADLTRRIEIAQCKLEKVKMDGVTEALDSDDHRHYAQEELALAQAKLEQFVAIESPNRLAQARLSLRGMKDRAQEAAEELAQIEIMYEEQDLDDRTAEFVVARGKRGAERAAAQVKIAETELLSLEQHTLPQELRRLKLDVDRKQASLAKAEHEAKSQVLGRDIALMSAHAELDKLEEELDGLEEQPEGENAQ